MLLTAGLFKRFKCFWTSSFCLDTLNLAAQDIEIKPNKQKTNTNTLLLLKAAPPTHPQEPIFTKNKRNPEKNQSKISLVLRPFDAG
jgi:hypothetical protein